MMLNEIFSLKAETKFVSSFLINESEEGSEFCDLFLAIASCQHCRVYETKRVMKMSDKNMLSEVIHLLIFVVAVFNPACTNCALKMQKATIICVDHKFIPRRTKQK
jgi:hypothetical protein